MAELVKVRIPDGKEEEMLACVGAALLAGEQTEMKVIFCLINLSPLGCPSHAITAERPKYLFFHL